MSKHLIYYGDSITDYGFKLIEVGTWEYTCKRLQFWKWYRHNTLGRPVLKLWRPQVTPNQRERE